MLIDVRNGPSVLEQEGEVRSECGQQRTEKAHTHRRRDVRHRGVVFRAFIGRKRAPTEVGADRRKSRYAGFAFERPGWLHDTFTPAGASARMPRATRAGAPRRRPPVPLNQGDTGADRRTSRSAGSSSVLRRAHTRSISGSLSPCRDRGGVLVNGGGSEVHDVLWGGAVEFQRTASRGCGRISESVNAAGRGSAARTDRAR